jgi:hypothetical protein
MEMTTGALSASFATSAFCAWVYDSRQATSTGDIAEARLATRTVARAPSWPAVRGVDPHPQITLPITPGGHRTTFGWMLPYRSAVLSGDLRQVNSLLASDDLNVACPAERPRAASKGGTVMPPRDPRP